jgi:hypothetical protein
MITVSTTAPHTFAAKEHKDHQEKFSRVFSHGELIPAKDMRPIIRIPRDFANEVLANA